MGTGYFITGTNTGVGKTYFACELLKYFANKNLTTLGLKPVAAGCVVTSQGLQNSDALLLQQHATCQASYSVVNPFAFAEPIAPHIAAAKVGITLQATAVAQHCQAAIAKHKPDITIVEGAGGWLVPLNHTETIAEVALMLKLPVILVVKLELGCINHTLLTYTTIIQSGLSVAGWVANCLDPNMMELNENIATIQARLTAPLLAYAVQDKVTFNSNLNIS